jgi:transcriptional regulator with XRE-family HTH domain
MEFNEKLQLLRKQKGLTQEELGEILFVSRTAISKWESGRGYPNIDSLKEIAKFFGLTVDQLLSCDELLLVAEEDGKQKENKIRNLTFGLIDICALLFFILPLFSCKIGGSIREVSLINLVGKQEYLKITYTVFVAIIALYGVIEVVLKNWQNSFWIKYKRIISLVLSSLCVLLFAVSREAYATVICFVFLAIKGLVFLKLK